MGHPNWVMGSGWWKDPKLLVMGHPNWVMGSGWLKDPTLIVLGSSVKPVLI